MSEQVTTPLVCSDRQPLLTHTTRDNKVYKQGNLRCAARLSCHVRLRPDARFLVIGASLKSRLWLRILRRDMSGREEKIISQSLPLKVFCFERRSRWRTSGNEKCFALLFFSSYGSNIFELAKLVCINRLPLINDYRYCFFLIVSFNALGLDILNKLLRHCSRWVPVLTLHTR